jgi:excisionase family DNA binding protein
MTQFADLPDQPTVPETAAYLGVGRGLVYALIRRGDIQAVRYGRLVRVIKDSLRHAGVTNPDQNGGANGR